MQSFNLLLCSTRSPYEKYNRVYQMAQRVKGSCCASLMSDSQMLPSDLIDKIPSLPGEDGINILTSY